ncbi:helix-turn-helix domain-containing protein [Acaricomes phytoseiuli]|uniref:DNA-3-methyladenine glycosylase 2 family protein n=1 Tax=Acaricomes phytoseiuli TaxID=291968 RepID=UPI00035E2CAA|nr:Ada metal-binding domain-containing protein [Acaricomes phytoseiuli]MCW1248856.1 helix-turn-helix domain-containing protein [Acaricomes phytoseiuli]
MDFETADFEQRYRVITARDTRFDGQFVTAVRSTGIYCRPSCPARTPRPENVSFYATSAAAHESGYRACKRCLPEAVPGTPEWNLRSDLAGRAMRLILDGAIDRGGVSSLAAQLGYSARQLNRILHAELGAGPLSLARATRAQTARTLLTGTTMRLADIAFASGFSSIRQFNDTVQEVFALTPSQLRSTAKPTGQQTPEDQDDAYGTEVNLRLPLRPPYDPGIFDFLAVRALAGVEIADARSYCRSLALPHGAAIIWVQLPEEIPEEGGQGPGASADHLRLRARLSEIRDLPVLLSRVRRLFDLDADPTAIDTALQPELGELILRRPGIRLPGALDATEMLLRAMVGQQISVAAAQTQLRRLAELGDPNPLARSGEPQRFAPTAQQISTALAADEKTLFRGPARRVQAIEHAMHRLAGTDGTSPLQLSLGDDLDSLRDKLLPLPGIGPWTVDYLALRLLGSPDLFLATDSAVRHGLAVSNINNSTPARFSPWGSYATMQLWAASAASTTDNRQKATAPQS